MEQSLNGRLGGASSVSCSDTYRRSFFHDFEEVDDMLVCHADAATGLRCANFIFVISAVNVDVAFFSVGVVLIGAV